MTNVPRGDEPILCLIVAVAENGVIGAGGKMAWHLPSELKYFRARTLGKPVIMGRKTFQSIGKPLPGRDNIVVSRNAGALALDGVAGAGSLDEAIDSARALAAKSGGNEIFVIGGGEIYRQALPQAGRVYLTRISATIVGDATFPALDPREWRLVSSAPLEQPPAEAPRAVTEVYERIFA